MDFPKIKKKISDFLIDEKGSIDKKKIITTGIIIGSISIPSALGYIYDCDHSSECSDDPHNYDDGCTTTPGHISYDICISQGEWNECYEESHSSNPNSQITVPISDHTHVSHINSHYDDTNYGVPTPTKSENTFSGTHNNETCIGTSSHGNHSSHSSHCNCIGFG